MSSTPFPKDKAAPARLIPLEMDYKADACVLGAGVSGLSAAYVMSRNRRQVVVLERANAVGGSARTMEVDGYRFDLGGHRFFSKDSIVNRFFEFVVGDELLWVPRKSRIYHGKRFFPYPLRLSGTLRNIGPVTASSIVGGYLWTQIRQGLIPRRIDSLEDWLISRFGGKLYRTFFQAYTEKVWGLPCTQLSHDWGCQRIREMSLYRSIRNIFLKGSTDQPATLIDRFMYPRKGIGVFSDSLHRLIGSGCVRLQSEVSRVALKGDRIAFVEVGDLPHRHRVEAREFISSLPLPTLIRLLDPAPPAQVQRAARRLTHRSLVTINLQIDRDSISDDTWVYIQDPGVRISRIHEPKNWSAEMAPQGRTSLVVEFPCSRGDDIWSAPEDRMLRMARYELTRRLGLLKDEEIANGTSRRAPQAYPVYHIGYEKPRRIVIDYLNTIANLQLVGRNGLHRYDNIDHCVEAGLKAGLNTLGSRFDLEAVNASPQYLEEHEGDPVAASEWLESASKIFPDASEIPAAEASPSGVGQAASP